MSTPTAKFMTEEQLSLVTHRKDLNGFMLTGKQSNGIMKKLGEKGLKFTNEDGIHNDFEYKEGLNVDTRMFQAQEACSGGLYSTCSV